MTFLVVPLTLRVILHTPIGVAVVLSHVCWISSLGGGVGVGVTKV